MEKIIDILSISKMYISIINKEWKKERVIKGKQHQ